MTPPPPRATIESLRGVPIIAALVFAGCNFSLSLTETGNGSVDARMVDGPPDDVDADGVKNDADNCPGVANAGQFDEDGDTRGDECDPCPQLGAAADDIDDDGDKLGNGCDPRRTMAGDALAYWNGFHVASSALPSSLTLLHGDPARWSVANGNLEFDRNGDDWGMPVVDVGKQTHTVDAAFQITASFFGAAAAGVAVDINASDTDLFDCQARTDNARREIWRRDLANPDGWTNLETQSAITPNDTYRITLHRTPTDLRCKTTRAGQISIDLENSIDSIQSTRAGLFARNVDVRFRYIAIYTSP